MVDNPITGELTMTSNPHGMVPMILGNPPKAPRREWTSMVLFGMVAVSAMGCAPKSSPPAEDSAPATTPQTPPAVIDSIPEAPESMIAVWEQAKARGVRFRGIGQEPGWIVDVLGDPGSERLELTADYGEIKLNFDKATREEMSAPPRTMYRAKSGDHSIEIEVTPVACADAMSGQPYENTVVVRFDGRELRGCGKAL